LERVRRILSLGEKPATATISCAFGCPFEGEVDPGAVADLCERLVDADELVLADTIGVATPRRVRRLLERVSILGRPVGFHGHNTRNTGYASVWGALEGGATVIDASIGGLGGCQVETPLRIARRPAHSVPHIQASPLACTSASTRSVSPSLAKRKSTWLRTTSLSTSAPSSRSPSANERAWAQQRSTSAPIPSRPSERIAAYTAKPRARRDDSGFQSIWSRSSSP